MVLSKNEQNAPATRSGANTVQHLHQQAREAIAAARTYAYRNVKPDGHWCGEIFVDVTMTCEYIFLMTWFKLDISADQEALIHHIRKEQRPDGSWALAPDAPSHVSSPTEAYLALKILGVDCGSPTMEAARKSILSQGGISSVRNITKIWLALFGILSWSDYPQMPAELIFIPANMPFSIYSLAAWARSFIVPLLILAHHKPVFELSGGLSGDSYLDELWCDPENKRITCGQNYWELAVNRDWVSFAMKFADNVLYLQSAIGLFPISWFRKAAIRKCMEFVLTRTEASGDYAPGYPPVMVALIAMHVEGITLDDPRMVRGLEALERHVVRKGREMYLQTTVSPVWDTILMCIGLLDSCSYFEDTAAELQASSHIQKALEWLQRMQNTACNGDWRIYRPLISPGAWSIQYHDFWNSDVDDTAAAVIVFLKHDATMIQSNCVVSAVEWLIGMQSSNGGYAAFEVDNNHFYLNKVPFCDVENLLCDPPSPDVTGRVLEAFGLFLAASSALDGKSSAAHPGLSKRVLRIRGACARAIDYLISEQEVNGSWYGRWGSCYVFGTSTVLCGLRYFLESGTHKDLGGRVHHGLDFLSSWQNVDGGWGESSRSYSWKPSEHENGTKDIPLHESTPSQTAWALMGLLAYQSTQDVNIQRRIRHLLETQTSRGRFAQSGKPGAVAESLDGLEIIAEGRTWPESNHTGTSLPNWMMMKYEYYPHYWPMMALGRFVAKVSAEASPPAYFSNKEA